MKVRTVKSIKHLPQTYWAGYYETDEEFQELLENFEERYGFYPQILYYVKGKDKTLHINLVDKLLPNKLDLIEFEQN